MEKCVSCWFINNIITYRNRTGQSFGIRFSWANSPVSRESVKDCNRKIDG